MQYKGTILIVEDHIQEKIGSFYDYIIKNNYSISTAENLEDADKKLIDLINLNEIDGIILDFAFPVNRSDLSPNIDGIPNGIVLLTKHLFKLNLKRIPVIINTTADETYKRKHLESLNLEMPIYEIDNELSPLSSLSSSACKEIIELFDRRSMERRIKPDRKWISKGGPFLRDENGKIIGYR